MRRIMAAAVVLLAASLPVRGATAQDSEGSTDLETVVLFIIDLSGSMNEDFGDGRTKLEVAKAAFKEAFERAPDDAKIGLRVYGDQLESQAPAARQDNCEKDTRLAVPIDSGNRDQVLKAVDGFEASGDTPIGLALQKTAEDDIPEEALATVVLFSDGRDECWDADLNGDPSVGPSWGPDPCEVAKSVAGAGVDLRIDKIDTIGFQAGDAEEQLRCIADSTGGRFTPIETEEDARDILPDVVATGTARPAVHLCPDSAIEGTPSADGAPDLERIEPGETSRCYTDTIGMNEERWYRIEDYGPGAGDTTVTFFSLPAVEGTTMELRMEPGPNENISSGLTETAQNENLLDPSDSMRCGGCHVVGSEETHTLYWVAALRSDDPKAEGTFELELLVEGDAWGGPASGCLEGMTCWYEAQIGAAEARLDELRQQLEGDEDTQALQSEVDELEAELASLTAKKQALSEGGSGGTNWLLPALLALVALGAGGVWFFQSRRGQSQPAAAGATTSASSGVIGTIDLGPSGTATASTPGAGDAGLPGEPLGEPTDLSAPGGREDVTEVPTAGSEPSGAEAPNAGREVHHGPQRSKDFADASGREVPPAVPGPDASGPVGGSKPAGWYGDPDAPDVLRWWDGNAWTDHTQRKG